MDATTDTPPEWPDYTPEDALVWEARVGGPWAAPMPVPPRKALRAVYGDPKPAKDRSGAFSVAWSWERENLSMSPALPGVPKVKRWGSRRYCHKLIHPFIVEAFRRAAIVAPEYAIQRVGFFCPRMMGSNPDSWSYHTWAVAVDINASANKARKRRLVTDMPPAFVWAFESVGWRWGGRWKNYVDPMHFELVE